VVAHQVNDEIEYLGLNMDRFPTPAQFLLVEVDLKLGESVFQYHFCLTGTRLRPVGRFTIQTKQKKSLPEEKQRSSQEIRQAGTGRPI
jgi:hypothetical protein